MSCESGWIIGNFGSLPDVFFVEGVMKLRVNSEEDMSEQKRDQETDAGKGPFGIRLWFRILPEEPFRIFFPLGLLVSIAGVCLWPLLYGGCLDFYPGVAHARLMMGGFVGAFSLGFLGTALPRMMGAPHLRGWEIVTLLTAYLSAVFAYSSGQIVLADVSLLVTLLFFFVAMVFRLIALRKDLPPPGFVLVGIGWLAAMSGLFLFLLEGGELVLTGARHRMASLLFYQAFILLPILGIGGFMFPRFVGLKTLHMFEESRNPAPGWSSRARLALGLGLLLIVTYGMESLGWILSAGLIRFAAVAWYLWREVLVFRKAETKGTLAFGLRAGLALILAAFPLAVFLPIYRIGLDHIIYISGFGLIALTVGTRVTLGHSGKAALFAKKINVMRVVIGSILLAMMTRVTAEFIPAIRVSHLNYAALCWAIAILLWLGWLGRRFFQTEE